MKPLTVKFGPVTAENIDQLRRLNAASFPVSYSESFYQDILKRSHHEQPLNRLAYHQNTLVGAMSARLDPSNPHRLYIMTLAVLAPYRGRGIGSQLLQNLLDYCTNSDSDIHDIFLHVQTSNVDAIRFYTERFGFEQGERIENYYSKRISPPHCHVIYKTLQQATSDNDTAAENKEDEVLPESESQPTPANVTESVTDSAGANVTDEESSKGSQ